MDLGWTYFRTPQRVPTERLHELDARRICIIKPSALGDIVQTLPLLAGLRERFPQAKISWVVSRYFGDLLDGHPDLESLIFFDRRGSWRSMNRLLRDLFWRRFDLVLDLQGLARTGVMTLATAASMRLGLETAREGAGLACHGLLPGTGRQVPAHLRYWRVAEAFGVEGPPPEAKIAIPQQIREWAVDRLKHLPRPILAIHAGAGWETKRWPIEKFAEIARRFPGSVLTVGSRGECPFASQIVAAREGTSRQTLDLCGRTSLKHLAALLSEADLMLSNDSGPMHLAAAMATPVVGVFTCTSPYLSGPAGAGHELVSAGVSCAASYRKECPHQGVGAMACLHDITVERVWQATLRLLERKEQPRRKTA